MEVKKFLSNSKMGKLVAHLLGKTDLAVELYFRRWSAGKGTGSLR